MREVFSAFVISSVVGANRPSPAMYHATLDTLGTPPDQAFFVDDRVWNCAGARQLGMRSALLCRDPRAWQHQKATCRRLPVRRDLAGIARLTAASGRN